MSTVSQQGWEAQLFSLAAAGWSEPARPPRGVQRDERELKRAYALCARVTANYSRTFSLATSLLPPAKRRAVRALYAFCRTADNLVDEQRVGTDVWSEFCEQVRNHRAAGKGSSSSQWEQVRLAWEDTRIRFAIPQAYVEQFLAGIANDLQPVPFRTFDELALYSYGVASTVGLMSMHIIGFQGRDAARYAVQLGVALQLTNILRDVGEDYRAGRIYLPQEDLAAFRLSEDDLAVGCRDERWWSFMIYQIARCRRLYAQARPGLGLLHPDGRLAVAAAADLYQGILDDIEAHRYDVFSRRAHLSAAGKLVRLPRILLRTAAIKPKAA
jgi:15-cis-phytoene synthase